MMKSSMVLNFGNGSLLMDTKNEDKVGVLKIKEFQPVGVGSFVAVDETFFDDAGLTLRFDNIESAKALQFKLDEVIRNMTEYRNEELSDFLNRQFNILFDANSAMSLGIDYGRTMEILQEVLFTSNESLTLPNTQLENGEFYIAANDLFAGYRNQDYFVVTSGKCACGNFVGTMIPIDVLSSVRFVKPAKLSRRVVVVPISRRK